MPRCTRRQALARVGAGVAALAMRDGMAQSRPPALSKRDWAAIKRVISDQLAALRKGDAERAFAYAAEGIRRQLGDAGAFMDMVQSGYADLLHARYTEFLEGAVIEDAIIQPLRLVGADNSVRVALYTMQKDGARWRIAGCVIAPSTVKAA